jgi:LuxR family maltose regulon positive regulatory protein
VWGQADISVLSFRILSSVLEARGDLDEALDVYQQAKRAAGEVSPWYGALQEGRVILLRLAQGDLSAADRWVEENGLRYDDAFEPGQERPYYILARILVAQGRLDQACLLLSRLVNAAQAVGAVRQVVRTLILHALVLRDLGKLGQAVDRLERALILAEPGGAIRTFTGTGSPIAGLLKQVAARGVAVGYVKRLLTELESRDRSMPSAAKPSSVPLIEPLSERELEVLRLLPTNLTSPAIARELYISRNTVRSHIGHIYDKLGVHSRAEAVQRAQELGLL